MWLLGLHLSRLQAQQQQAPLLTEPSHQPFHFETGSVTELSPELPVSAKKLSSSSQSSCLSAQSAGIIDKCRCWEPQATFLAAVAVCFGLMEPALA